jgi:hypothetical protein
MGTYLYFDNLELWEHIKSELWHLSFGIMGSFLHNISSSKIFKKNVPTFKLLNKNSKQVGSLKMPAQQCSGKMAY